MADSNTLELAPIAVVDVHYSELGASAACVVAGNWLDAAPVEVRRTLTTDVAEYVPGQFYRREMPAVLSVLREVATDFKVIIVDSYVVLDEQGSPGLGAHLYEHFAGRYPVVGIAKTSYQKSAFARAVLRGGSKRPLFVTALGLDREDAALRVSAMHGEHRIPTLVHLADSYARRASAIPDRFRAQAAPK